MIREYRDLTPRERVDVADRWCAILVGQRPDHYVRKAARTEPIESMRVVVAAEVARRDRLES